ncbi:hypothetical protein ACIP6X_24175 [Streptomyces coeruleorubidus]|uniref:hypothetical protein n=1 Tax=Streptomyces coeruleorubidus TaxID=116188 RepID=UPI00381157FD
MTSVAVTGHMDLTDRSLGLVRAALDRLLVPYRGPELAGLSCLAAGADSVFAQAVLAAGGRIVAVLPARGYRADVVDEEHAPLFDRLLAEVEEVIVLPHATANRHAYEAANAELLRRADRLVAVWNGEPPSGKGGGTADTVHAARAAAIPVDVVWPEGASRARG